MQIEGAKRHGLKNGLWQDDPIGDDHSGFGLVRAKRRFGLARAQCLGRKHRQPELARLTLDRARPDGHTPAHGFRRAGVDGDHVMPAPDDLGERRHRKFGRAHEDEAEGHRIFRKGSV